MGSGSRWLRDMDLAWLVARAIAFSVFGILLLITFIVLRRWYRQRYFNQLNRRTVALREQWPDILSGKIPGSVWRINVLDRHQRGEFLLRHHQSCAKDHATPRC